MPTISDYNENVNEAEKDDIEDPDKPPPCITSVSPPGIAKM